MQDDDEPGEDIGFRFAIGEDEQMLGEWSGWEQSRTRSFFAAGPQTIGDGKLGSVANMSLELTCKRVGAGFEAGWTASFEERIGPNRIDRGEATGFILAGQTRIQSFRMPQFARACGTRRHQWQGSLTREEFDRVTGFMTDGEVRVRRC